MTRFFWCCVIALIILTLGNMAQPPREVHGLFPDERVRWEIEHVDGFILQRPGDKAQITLPGGSLLYIPHVAKRGYSDSTSHSS